MSIDAYLVCEIYLPIIVQNISTNRTMVETHKGLLCMENGTQCVPNKTRVEPSQVGRQSASRTAIRTQLLQRNTQLGYSSGRQRNSPYAASASRWCWLMVLHHKVGGTHKSSHYITTYKSFVYMFFAKSEHIKAYTRERTHHNVRLCTLFSGVVL